MMEATSGEAFGLMQDGAGVKLLAQSIPFTGGSSTTNGGVAILMKWCNSKIIYPCCISIGTRRMLSVAGPGVAYQRKLSGNWLPAPTRPRMVAELLRTSDSFHGAMKRLNQTERIWIGVIWVASM